MFRIEDEGRAIRDVLADADETLPGRPLLEPVMKDGVRLPAGRVELELARQRARREIALLPEHVRELEPADPPYPVVRSEELSRRHQELLQELGRTELARSEER